MFVCVHSILTFRLFWLLWRAREWFKAKMDGSKQKIKTTGRPGKMPMNSVAGKLKHVFIIIIIIIETFGHVSRLFVFRNEKKTFQNTKKKLFFSLLLNEWMKIRNFDHKQTNFLALHITMININIAASRLTEKNHYHHYLQRQQRGYNDDPFIFQQKNMNHNW